MIELEMSTSSMVMFEIVPTPPLILMAELKLSIARLLMVTLLAEMLMPVPADVSKPGGAVCRNSETSPTMPLSVSNVPWMIVSSPEPTIVSSLVIVRFSL